MPTESQKREAEMLQEQPYDASDKVQVNNQRKKAARWERERLEVVHAIMSTPQGRFWMKDLLDGCKLFSNPVVPGDPYYTYHNIGEQNVGKRLLIDINNAAPKEYILMMEEARTKK